jgi:hypothetical protein
MGRENDRMPSSKPAREEVRREPLEIVLARLDLVELGDVHL